MLYEVITIVCSDCSAAAVWARYMRPNMSHVDDGILHAYLDGELARRTFDVRDHAGDTMKGLVITSYSIHYTKLYEK